MGCYLSAPDRRVYVSEGKGKDFSFVTASCQGWRKEQEDAEECIPYYDDNASLFVLCDGHGGAEVAKYTVQHLPDFIKNHPLYKEGNYEKALEEAFIDFDEHLKSDKVMEELNRIAHDEDDREKDDDQKSRHVMDLEGQSSSKQPEAGGSSSSAGPSSSNGPSSVVEDVDSETLKREAHMPLLDLIGRYTGGIGPAERRSLLPNYNASPVVKTRKEDSEGGDTVEDAENKPGPSSSKPNDELAKTEIVRHLLEKYFPDDDSSDDSEYEGEEPSDDEDGDDECDFETGEGESSGPKKLRRKKHKRAKSRRVESSSNDESDGDLKRSKGRIKKSDEGLQEEGEAGADSGSSERSRSSSDDDADDSDDEEDADEGEEDENDEEDDDDDDGDEDEDEEVEGEDDGDDDPLAYGIQNFVKPGSRTHVPGKDSGCTVVVALVKDNKIYVASAGDSRCILILRNGECKPMSFDHKPEDTIERQRITKAGGRILDGRVNGGLNLSRAFGDFCYKNRSDLGPREQMITALPDVKTAQLDPKEVKFIVLACDGIWNSMKNKEVAKFIPHAASTLNDNLTEVCIHLFRRCMAPGTDGDGTGCDNMTCIIAELIDPTLKQDPENGGDLNSEDVKESDDSKTSSNKRSTNDDSGATSSKRKCLRL